MNNKYYLAIDIGASSGRGIVGYQENNETKMVEVYRFKNGNEEINHHLVWNLEHLFQEVKNTIKIALKSYPLESVAIDTWGVDYVLMHNDQEIKPCYAYRDERTLKVINEVHSFIPFEKLYQQTGIQFQPFNTIYQLYADLKSQRLENVTDFLMIPEYLNYKLTGIKMKEYTNATTTGLINKESNCFDLNIINNLKLPPHLFKTLNQPKDVVGYLTEDVQKEVGGNVKVVLCATHDTASAVNAIDLTSDDMYISSGTWSLLGTKVPKVISDEASRLNNWSNEGGLGYIRYQKNIMGMWLVQCLQAELCPDKPFDLIVREVEKCPFNETIDANDESLLAPKSMKQAISALLGHEISDIEAFRCAYLSLAKCYSAAIKELQHNTQKDYQRLIIVGGGAKNTFLNKITALQSEKEVVALPIEATALGNLKIQMEVK